jgi:hypothetical protein
VPVLNVALGKNNHSSPPFEPAEQKKYLVPVLVLEPPPVPQGFEPV